MKPNPNQNQNQNQNVREAQPTSPSKKVTLVAKGGDEVNKLFSIELK